MDLFEDVKYVPVERKQTCISFDQVTLEDKKFAENLKCPICIELVHNPYTCSNCYAVVGENCIQNWMDRGKNTCPYGCPNFTKKQKNDPTLMKLLETIHLSCENKLCQETLSHETYFNHLKKCLFKIYKCNAKNCTFIGHKKLMEKHVDEECEFFTKFCPVCKKEILLKHFLQHSENCKTSPKQKIKSDRKSSFDRSPPNKKLPHPNNQLRDVNVILENQTKQKHEKQLKFLKKVGVFAICAILLLLSYFAANTQLKTTSKAPQKSIINEIKVVNNAHFPSSNIYDVIDQDEINTNTTNSQILYHKGLEALEAKKYQQALKDFFEALKLDPNNSDILNNIGFTKEKLNKYEDAIMFYEKALAKNGSNPYVLNNLGLFFHKRVDYQLAVNYFLKAIKLNPKIKEFYNNLGYTYMINKKYLPAVENFKKAIAINSNFLNAYLNLGTAYAGLGMYNKAIEYYNRVIYNNPSKTDVGIDIDSDIFFLGRNEIVDEKNTTWTGIHKEAYFYKGLSQVEIGNWVGAIDSFRKTLIIDPHYYFGYYNLGRAQEKIGSLNEAIKNFKKTIHYHPKFKKGYQKLGSLLSKTGNKDDAIKVFLQNLKIAPTHKKDYFSIGSIYYEMNRCEDAKVFLKQAIKLDPHYKEAYYVLGACKVKPGKIDRAIYYFKEALDIDSNYEPAIKYLEKIYTLYPDKTEKIADEEEVEEEESAQEKADF